MKITFSTWKAPFNRLWTVNFNKVIRIVSPHTHDYLMGIFPTSDDGALLLPVTDKEVYIDFTSRQFFPNAPYPTVYTEEGVYEMWDNIEED